MKIAVISDTHDNNAAVAWIIKYLNEQHISLALHAGDMIAPGVVSRFLHHFDGSLHFVFGNNDGELSAITQIAVETDKLICHNREMELELAGHIIYMNHYSSTSETKAAQGKYDICIGGHDHSYRVEKIGNSLFINPGHTVIQDRFTQGPDPDQLGFVVLNLDDMTTERVLIPSNYFSL